MKPIEITQIPAIITKKGTTIEWCKGKPGMQVTVYYRAKDTFFAQHFHKGEDSSKKPELFLLLQGKIEFTYIDPSTGEKISHIIEQGTEVKVQPYVKHQAKALENCIFIEYRSQVFNTEHSDTYSVDPAEFT
jgi:hypothetical protein